MLKLKSQIQPDIDIFTLQIILQNFIKRVRLYINQIKEQCQKNNLKEAMYMRLDLDYFQRQLAEIEERSTCTYILASYYRH